MTTPPHVLAAVRSIPHPREETAVPAPELTADVRGLLDQLDQAHAAATPGPWHQDEEYPEEILVDRRVHVASCDEEDGAADAALIVAAVNALPTLIAALQNVLTGCDHLDRMRPTFSSAEARMAYADATKHIRACLTAALSPAEVTR